MWAIYSPEDFPKRTEDGWADYRQALGVQIILHAHQWTELHGQADNEIGYTIEYFNNFVDARGDGKEIFVSCKQVAERICGDFALRGLRFAELDKLTPERKKEIEEDGEAANMRWRKGIIERFEISFRERMLGNPGRLSPTNYERECYKICGGTPPDVVQRAAVPVSVPQVIVAQPDQAMIAELVAKEVERLTAPKGA